MNILMLILSLIWVIAFVVYTKVVADNKSKNGKVKNALMNVAIPAVILFCAIYTTASWIVGFKTRDAIMADPSVLIDASERLQQIEQEKAMEASKDALNEITEDDSKYAPVIGNKEGNVVLYEFFDYNCGFCKRGAQSIKEVLTTENDVKVVLKNLPIFGSISELPARAVIAAQKQGKVAELHDALFETNLIPQADENTTEEEMLKKIEANIMKIAKDAGLDTKQLKEDMKDPSVDEEITRTRELASKLMIQGTPAYIVGDQFFRGYIDANQMRTAIQQAR